MFPISNAVHRASQHTMRRCQNSPPPACGQEPREFHECCGKGHLHMVLLPQGRAGHTENQKHCRNTAPRESQGTQASGPAEVQGVERSEGTVQIGRFGVLYPTPKAVVLEQGLSTSPPAPMVGKRKIMTSDSAQCQERAARAALATDWLLEDPIPDQERSYRNAMCHPGPQ